MMARIFGATLVVSVAFAACSFDDRTLVVHGAGASSGHEESSGGAGETSTVGSANEAGAPGSPGGEKCRADADCASNSCLDGVCCATSCDGKCVSCAQSVTGKPDGACEAVRAGMDPHDDCAQGKDVCGLDGQCDGAGACRYAVPATKCGEQACGNDKYTPPAQCDGAGACVTPEGISCAGHPCVDGRCDIPCGQSADCPSGLYCDGEICLPQAADGSDCAADDECANGHCSSDNLCCDEVCSDPCYSCLQADTGQTDGKCAPVLAGRTHGDDCPGSASCNPAGTGVTGAPACDGAGACESPADVSCGNYTCNAASASCNTACGSAGDCSSSAYCAGGACKPKVGAGALCSTDVQCQSGDCSGRCCASGTTCDCPQPSAGNVIKNPGFDKDLSGWTIDAGSAVINWQPGTFMTGNQVYADGHSCPYSGAAYVSNPSMDQNSQLIWQCVALKINTDYNFGVQQATLAGSYTHCMVDKFQGPGCTGGSVSGVVDSEWINVAWSGGDFPQSFNSGGFVSAKVYCYVEPSGSFFFDDVYLTPSPGKY